MGEVAFRQHIRASIANESLQAALDANAERRAKGRLTAFASLPDWRERRRTAHAVRAEVIEHLDRYLDEFSARAAQNGIVVHRAADAEQAVSLVLEIAQAFGAASGGDSDGKLFAKSKSMVSEEIELNRALKARGHRVIETDLGEYIVQLRGEKPAHIITPAVHLRRGDVGQLFQEKLGLPYTEDIGTLTEAARKALRDVFLKAEIGISGVNFGVAESGTVCIVTNEGNGRMVTTLPPLHIALMGMERLVPTLADLALMLSLLPRSATGQKLSVYTQLIHSPRRTGEIDGAIQRHLILVDNGRLTIRDSGLSEALYCIRCGACLNACPVFREIGGHAYVGADGAIAPYPGPIGSVVSPGLLGLRQFGHLAQASSLCGACKDACPVDIDLPRLLTKVRAGAQKRAPGKEGTGLSGLSRIGMQAYSVIAARSRLFEFSQRLAGIAARIFSPFSDWMQIPAFTGWGTSKDFPRPAMRPFRARFRVEVSHVDAQGAVRPKPAAAVHEDRGIETKDDSAEPLINKFVQELVALGAHAYRVSPGEVHKHLIRMFGERDIEAVSAWDDIEGMEKEGLKAAGVRLIRGMDPTVKAGITGAALAIAETGTLVLPCGPGQPLSPSLLPEVHVAIVASSKIVRSLDDAFHLPEIRQASSVVLVTGPSRTADIEMTLTIGVHGPKELHVLIIDEQE